MRWFRDTNEGPSEIPATDKDPSVICIVGPLMLSVNRHQTTDEGDAIGTYEPQDPGILVWYEWAIHAIGNGFYVDEDDDLAQGVSWTSQEHARKLAEACAALYLTDEERASPVIRISKLRVTMDILDGEYVEAHAISSGRWNGWACPMFTREQATALGELLEKTGAGSYRWDGDVFETEFIHDDQAQPDRWPKMTTKEGRPDLWDIGAFAWCWQTEEDREAM